MPFRVHPAIAELGSIERERVASVRIVCAFAQAVRAEPAEGNSPNGHLTCFWQGSSMNSMLTKTTATRALVLVAATLCACTTGGTQAKTTTTQLRFEPHAPTVLVATDDAGTAQPVASRCSFTVSEARGCNASDVETLLEPTRTRIEACRGANGKVRVRVYEEAGTVKFRIEPGSSLDATQRRCLLEALSTIDDGSNLSTGATVRPTGFSSLVTIGW